MTYTNITTLPAMTVTAASVTVTPTKLVTPKPVIVTSTKVLYTVARTIPEVTVAKVTKVVTASCAIPPRQTTPDKTCRIKPTVAHAAAFDGGRKFTEPNPGVAGQRGPTPPPFFTNIHQQSSPVTKATAKVTSVAKVVKVTSVAKGVVKSSSAKAPAKASPVKEPAKASPVKSVVKSSAAKAPAKSVVKSSAAKAPAKTSPAKAVVKSSAAKAPAKTSPVKQPAKASLVKKPAKASSSPKKVITISKVLVKTSTVKPKIPTNTKFTFKAAPSPSSNRFGRMFWARDLNDRPKFLAERSARLEAMGVEKRAPDQPTVTVTNTNTAVWPTVTKTSLAPTQYMTMTITDTVYKTVKPAPVTVLKGQKTAHQVVITLPTSTRTSTKYTVVSTTTTKVVTHT
jgi:DNA-binding protein HU-beta